MTPKCTIEFGAMVIEKEAIGLISLSRSLGNEFSEAVEQILECTGKVIITGIGKSGHIARKIAATFASTGTPSVFIHPTEASHGDLGIIEKHDTVVAISKSGDSAELNDVLSYCRRFKIPIIGITANKNGNLATISNKVLFIPDIEEACPLGLAPTTSTTMIMALGDALASACLQIRNFKPAQFKVYHPGGKLGQKLSRIRDVMHKEGALPLISSSARLLEAVVEMSRGRFGCVGVIDTDNELIGVFTDGDLRRYLSTATDMTKPITELMHASPQYINPDAYIADLVNLFAERRIPSVFACVDKKPVGIIHFHDILEKGLI